MSIDPLSRGAEAACPLCRSRDLQVVERVPVEGLVEGYRVRHRLDVGGEMAGIEDLHLLRCGGCALLFFSPMTSGSAAFYDCLQAFDWYYADQKHEFDFARGFVPAGATVLEVGCGKGAFAAGLDTVKYVGLELSEGARARAREAGLEVLGESVQAHAAAHPAAYDAVCAFQVLEHVPAVREFLEACVACLKPGGVLMLSVPSADSFARDVPNFILDMPPHHLTRWSDATLAALARLLPLDGVDLWHEPLQRVHRNLYAAAHVKAVLGRALGAAPRAWNGSVASRAGWLLSGGLGWILARWPGFGAAAQGISVTAVYRKRA